MGHFLQINRALSNGRLQEWPRAWHCDQSAGAPSGRVGGLGPVIIGDFCPRSCRRPPKMLRHQYFAYHALIRLAPIRVSGENHLDSRSLPNRQARLCAITPTPLRGLTVIVADQRPFDELMVVLRDLHMGEALPIPARIPPLPRAQRHGQRLPAGDGPGTGAGLRGVGDGGEQPAQLDRGRQLAALLESGTDRCGLCLGDDEHRRSWGLGP